MILNIIICGLLSITSIFTNLSVDEDKNKVQQVVNTFFNNYNGDYSLADKTLLAKPTIEKINRAVTHEIKDAQRLKELNSTDKPDLLEGDLFSGLYEGYTNYMVGDITFNGENAIARIHFVNNDFDKYSWYSDVVLVKEEGDWKIYNVIYFKDKKESGSLLKTLFVFLDKKTSE